MSDGLSGMETTPLKRDLRTLQQMLLDGQTSPAIELSGSLLMRSRSKDERAPFSEARIRMERALMGAVAPSWWVQSYVCVLTGAMHCIKALPCLD